MERDRWYGYLLETFRTDMTGQFIVSMRHFLCWTGIVTGCGAGGNGGSDVLCQRGMLRKDKGIKE